LVSDLISIVEMIYNNFENNCFLLNEKYSHIMFSHPSLMVVNRMSTFSLD
jgi:hypothetical protein